MERADCPDHGEEFPLIRTVNALVIVKGTGDGSDQAFLTTVIFL